MLPSPVTALYKPPTPAPIRAPPTMVDPIPAAAPVPRTAAPTEVAAATNALLVSSL